MPLLDNKHAKHTAEIIDTLLKSKDTFGISNFEKLEKLAQDYLHANGHPAHTSNKALVLATIQQYAETHAHHWGKMQTKLLSPKNKDKQAASDILLFDLSQNFDKGIPFVKPVTPDAIEGGIEWLKSNVMSNPGFKKEIDRLFRKNALHTKVPQFTSPAPYVEKGIQNFVNDTRLADEFLDVYAIQNGMLDDKQKSKVQKSLVTYLKKTIPEQIPGISGVASGYNR